MMDCHCGKVVRLGAYRISVNRKRGVAHYIAHMDGTTICDGPWECTALKPYPKNESEKQYVKLINRWDDHQRQSLGKTTTREETK